MSIESIVVLQFRKKNEEKTLLLEFDSDTRKLNSLHLLCYSQLHLSINEIKFRLNWKEKHSKGTLRNSIIVLTIIWASLSKTAELKNIIQLFHTHQRTLHCRNLFKNGFLDQHPCTKFKDLGLRNIPTPLNLDLPILVSRHKWFCLQNAKLHIFTLSFKWHNF